MPEAEAEAEMPLSIELAVEHDAWEDHLARTDHVDDLEALAARAVAAALDEATLDGAGLMTPLPAIADGAELSILLADDAFVRTLNKQWRGKDAATNVLSFPAAGPARAMTLGDIAVAYETSAQEAADRGMALADYLTHLLIHGVLHLIGYDHETDAEADEMEALESRALLVLGIASPYEPAAHAILSEPS